MNTMIRTFFLISSLLLFLPLSVKAAPQTFILDPQHTYVLWHINHFGFSTQAGKWYASGTLILDQQHPQNTKVDANIQVANMITGIPELDKHLRGKLFFDVAKFPTAHFVSNKVTMTGKDTAKVQGILTVHGISKPVTLDVTLNQAGMSPITNKMTAGFSAHTQFKRSEFNINTAIPGLADEVSIDIGAEAYQQTK
jgi:polyisoprenoid-binding protein YceI